jgi:hypothetical protein
MPARATVEALKCSEWSTIVVHLTLNNSSTRRGAQSVLRNRDQPDDNVLSPDSTPRTMAKL